jgi:hypothetical protein
VDYISELQLLSPAAFLAHRAKHRHMAALQQERFRVGLDCVGLGMLVLTIYDPLAETSGHDFAFFRLSLGLFILQ